MMAVTVIAVAIFSILCGAIAGQITAIIQRRHRCRR